MSEVLPSEMVSQLEALGTALVAWGRAYRDAPLAEQKQAVLGLVRAALSAGGGEGPPT